MAPIIGITCNTTFISHKFDINREYVSAIESVGGVPILLPPVSKQSNIPLLLGVINGLLLSGGEDVDPNLYGEEPTQGTKLIDFPKDRLEISLIKLAIERNIPIFGICRGCQVLNVAKGGTLHQESIGKIEHFQNTPREYPTHTITIKKNTKLSKICKREKLRVNSRHRQSIKDVAKGFIVSAVAEDGVIEAIESNDKSFVLGVQFHPELLWRDNIVFKRLFSSFVSASSSSS